jgi:hypothetical protein
MTTPAAATTSGPIASAAPRPAAQAAADPFAFGAVLDSLPGASAKADASIAGRTLATGTPFVPGATPVADLAAQSPLNGESGLVAGFSPAEAISARPSADAFPSIANAASATPIASRMGAPPTHRGGLTRAAAHEAARIGQKADVSAPPPAARVATSAAVHALAESSGKAADCRTPDPIASAAPAAARTDLFGAQLSVPFAAGASFQLDGSTTSAGHVEVAPRASALAAGPALSAAPIREIDVDLSPGGLEDVSMTMRLAGDKLSVVIRAASSQTLGSIEGARDAIADRMAAIGQPLHSLIVKQTGVNTDGNANGNGSSADGGSAGDEQRSAQGAGERGSNDALSRRSAGRDRSF